MRKIINIEVLEALPIDGENKTLILLAEKAPTNLKVGERVQIDGIEHRIIGLPMFGGVNQVEVFQLADRRNFMVDGVVKKQAVVTFHINTVC
ncbi:hypothetical protein [Lacticaseibacillus paracasei]|uniref:hypothetical protein n=1 Tax=Lacticaseibacillus paracasei TaxID=1597 RepID=UPI000E59FA9A|nr:hypothetical protein [Lacticaseibacillus paracasei]RHX74939.1 hypothetical protein D2U14_00095 [Lacticaseibacillus paracasei]